MSGLIARLHREEEGLEALQVVVIMGIAALLLGVIKLAWPNIKTFFNNVVNAVIKTDTTLENQMQAP